jgi:hypothetical protein
MSKKRGGGRVTGGVLIASFVVTVIALALTPTVASLTTTSAANLSAYASAQDIIELIPLFWAILALAVPVVAIGLYFAGV